MTYPLSDDMTKILSLTKAGRVKDATALIQRGLGFGNVAVRSATPPGLHPIRPLSLPAPQTVEGAARVKQTSTVQSSGSSSFERHTFRNAAGSLDYLLFRPANYSGNVPLVIMLHGCTQSANDFAAGTQMNVLAEKEGFIVAYPEQPRSANMQKCWNWFRKSDQGKASGEPAVIAGITREIIEGQSIDSSRVYVAGLSAGGAAASIMARAFPDLYSAAGIHSGLACGSAKDMPSAFAAMQGNGTPVHTDKGSRYVPLITFHGTRDNTVHPVNSDRIHAAWEAAPEISGLIRKSTDGRCNGRRFEKTAVLSADGRSLAESWSIEGAGHAWSGGSPAGSYTDRKGPDASAEMVRFFLQHRLG